MVTINSQRCSLQLSFLQLWFSPGFDYTVCCAHLTSTLQNMCTTAKTFVYMVFSRSTTQGFVQITLPFTPRIRSALHTISVPTKFISKIRLKSSSFYPPTLFVALISVISVMSQQILHSLSLEVFKQNRFLIFRCSRVHLRLYYIGWVHERVAPPASARCGLVACSPGLLAERGGAHTEHAYRSVPANHNPPLTLKHTLGRIEWRIFLFLETIAQLLFHFLFVVTFLNCIAFTEIASLTAVSLLTFINKHCWRF